MLKIRTFLFLSTLKNVHFYPLVCFDLGFSSHLFSRGFESGQEHKKNFFPSHKGCADSLSVCPTPVCIRLNTKDYARTLKIL